MKASINEVALHRALVDKGGLWEFSKCAWPEIESDPLVPSWHMEEICVHLEAVTRRDIKLLIICIPPGCTKSTIVSVLWPSWQWIRQPEHKFMFATFDVDLMYRDADRQRRLIRNPWFQARWNGVQIATSGDARDTMQIFNTTKGGRRHSVTVAGKGTGWHAHTQVVDDPTNPKDVRGEPLAAREALDRTWRWWTGTMASRRANPKTFARVIIMQRLHEEDLVGRILNSPGADKWTVLSLPMEYEPESACVTPIGGDRRRDALSLSTRDLPVDPVLLCPARFDQAAVDEMKADMTEQVAAAQMQQRPAPASGNIFKRDWFKERWLALPANLFMVQSWDFAFKDQQASDFVSGTVWGFADAKFYLIDRIHRKMGLPESCDAIRTFMRRWPKARAKLIEAKANGDAVEQVLRDEIPGIEMIEPDGGKIARANAVTPLCRARNVVLPDPAATVKVIGDNDGNITELTYEWVDEFVEELVGFPFARHDDDVDSTTQAIIHLHDSYTADYLAAMERVRRDGGIFGLGRRDD